MDLFCFIEKTKTKIKKDEKIFFTEKYIPEESSDFIIHKDIVDKLYNFVDQQNRFTLNTFLYGKNDSGKYTLFKYIIRELYNENPYVEKNTFEHDGKEINYYKGKTHYEIHLNKQNCNYTNLYKKLFQKIIIPLKSKTFGNDKNIILIKNINLLKNETIKLIKYYLDKHYNNIFFLIGEQTIKDLNGFFYNLRVPLPSNEEITKFLKVIIKKEKLKVKKKELNFIIKKGERCISRTICLLETSYIDGEYIEYFNSNEKIINLIYKLLKTPTILKISKIREFINQLLVNNISITFIFYQLIKKISNDKTLEKEQKILFIQYITEGEHNFRKGYREIFHIEYCLIRIMNSLLNSNN